MFRLSLVLLVIGSTGLVVGCKGDEKKPAPQKSPAKVEEKRKPERLYLPQREQSDAIDLSDGSHQADDVSFGGPPVPGGTLAKAGGACTPEMVSIAGEFCIDRFEFTLVDRRDGRELSPHYPPSKRYTTMLFERWTRKAPQSKKELGRTMPIPQPPDFQLTEDFAPRARSVRGELPHGYMTRGLAEAACKNAGKRLCTRREWVRACRGEADTRFPYGNEYRAGTCNVFRENHPAKILHGDASKNHLDPRLGLMEDEAGPLLQRTGTSTECASRWGNDAVYDMVGNLDEWIFEPEGSFLGGFYSRGTTDGCESSIDSHAPGYLDYSLGGRCCSDVEAP